MSADIIYELNSQARNLKEEIHSTFSRHKKLLESREKWLLDQVDSIKNGTVRAIVDQNLSVARVEGGMEECQIFLKFSQEHKFPEAVSRASDVMATLEKKLFECKHEYSAKFPSIKFIHDATNLRDSILSYGKLEAKSCVEEDETDSLMTEKSWDLVEEDGDEKDNDTPDFQNRCSGVSNRCCDTTHEIEDMDFSSIVLDDYLCQEQTCPDFDKSDILKKFCRANEVCASISDCVCDKPCIKIPPQIPEGSDPVNELHSKLRTIHTCQNESQSKDWKTNQFTDMKTDESAGFVDPLLQIRSAVQDILGTTSQSINSENTRPAKLEENNIVDDLNLKLQKIIDGEATNKVPLSSVAETDFYQFTESPPAYNKSVPCDISADDNEKKYWLEYREPKDEVETLHTKLAEIYQRDVISEPSIELLESKCLDNDPVNSLSHQLHQILSH